MKCVQKVESEKKEAELEKKISKIRKLMKEVGNQTESIELLNKQLVGANLKQIPVTNVVIIIISIIIIIIMQLAMCRATSQLQ